MHRRPFFLWYIYAVRSNAGPQQDDLSGLLLFSNTVQTLLTSLEVALTKLILGYLDDIRTLH